MRIIVFLLFAIIANQSVSGQNELDSLLFHLPNTVAKERTETLITISKLWQDTNPDTAMYFTRQAIANAKEFRQEELLAKAYNRITVLFAANVKNHDSAIYYSKKSYEIYFELGLMKPAVRRLIVIGDEYSRKFEFEDAINYLSRAVELANDIDYANMEENALLYLGTYYYRISEYDNAIKSFVNALKINEKTGNNNLAGEIYNQLGATYVKIGNNEKALEYFEKANSLIYNPVVKQNINKLNKVTSNIEKEDNNE